MKYFFTLVWAVICLIVLVYGHSYWSERTAVKAEPIKAGVPSVTEKKEIAVQSSTTDIFAKTKNWPTQARSQFQQALQENKPYKILFVGSKALGSMNQGMLKNVVQQLTGTYDHHLDISIHTYDTTSKQFLANKDEQEIAAEKAQLIVLEPFILNDNGNVAINDSLNNLTKIIDAVKEVNPDTVFVLQPSYPLYQSIHYPVQTAKLKQYAQQNQIAYLDHWSAWPAVTSAALKNDLLPNQSAPNDKGNQIWSQYLINYFISK